MKTFEAIVTTKERGTWTVEAETAEEALEKFEQLTDDVIVDDVPEIVDWEVGKVKEVK